MPRHVYYKETPPAEARVAHELETASFRQWSEDRPVFDGIRPTTAALAWERNLRSLQLKPHRSGNVVECQTQEGYTFSLSFWEDKEKGAGKTIGEMVWHDPGNAGRGMGSLLLLEQKRAEEGQVRRTNRWALGEGYILPVGAQKK
ncbi:MAG: hypothetical protein U0793_23000 [Gemmataceae bacterium]